MHNKIGIKGLIEITVRGKDGKVKKTVQLRNLIVNAGLAGLASRINGNGAEAAFTYLEIGTGTTAAGALQTALITPITDSGLERAAATCSRTETNVANDTAKLSKTWTATGSKAVTEVGAFNAASDGTMLGRQVFTAVNVDNGDSLQVDYSFVSANA